MTGSGSAARVMLTCGLLVGIPCVPLRGAVYPIEKVVEVSSNDTRSHFLYSAAINDSGAVAYLGTLSEVGQPTSLYLGRVAPDGTTTSVPIAREDYNGQIPSRMAISNPGTITMPGDRLLRFSPDGTLTRVAYPVTTVTGFAASRVDDTLPVVASGPQGVFNGPDPVADRLDDPSVQRVTSPVHGLGADGEPRFIAERPDGKLAVFKGPDLQADFVMDMSAYAKAATYRENARGDVLFMASRAGGGFGLYRGPDPVADRVLDNTTALRPAGAFMNDDGQVVLLGRVGESSDVAFYAGTDPSTDRIIGVGDALFGSTIWDVSANPQDGAAFNNRGQLAFHYRLRDGRNGVAVVTVPEPAGAAFAAALTAAGAAALLRGRRRPRDRPA